MIFVRAQGGSLLVGGGPSGPERFRAAYDLWMIHTTSRYGVFRPRKRVSCIARPPFDRISLACCARKRRIALKSILIGC